jgi:hypothetical protein
MSEDKKLQKEELLPEEQEKPQKENNLDDWLATERSRLDRGFQFEPKPTSDASTGSATVESALAGAGLGAGVLAGAAAPHSNPTVFQGVDADVIINALREELADNDTQVQVQRSDEACEVTVLQAQDDAPYTLLPALTATLIDRDNTLTVSVSDLNQRSVRTTLSSMGGTVLKESKDALLKGRRRGAGGLIDTAGNVIRGIENVVENIQDLGLPARVWKTIDRVGNAAEQAFLDEQAKLNTQRQAEEKALRAWTHCPYCGRGYTEDESALTQCPSCGGTRGVKPSH